MLDCNTLASGDADVINTTLQLVSDVLAEATGGTTAQGVRLLDRGAELNNVVARARDAVNNEGMRVTCSFFFQSGPISTVRNSVLDGTAGGESVRGTVPVGFLPARASTGSPTRS